MTHNEMIDFWAIVVQKLQPEETTEFANVAHEAIMSSYNAEDLKVIADQLDKAGITIAGIPCKRIPA